MVAYDCIQIIDNRKMRSNDTFNIITGQVKRPFKANTHNRRFASLDVLRRMKDQTQPIRTQTSTRPLGTAQDHQLYQYSYLPKNQSFGNTQVHTQSSFTTKLPRERQLQAVSLINASKNDFNIISHGVDFLGEANWQSTKRTCPISKFTELGRMYAPNFRQDFKQQGSFRKTKAICGNDCELQRSYGTQKMFRKYK